MGGSAPVLDYDQGQQVADLRAQLRRLIADHVPADYLGAFTDDPGMQEIFKEAMRLREADRRKARRKPATTRRANS